MYHRLGIREWCRIGLLLGTTLSLSNLTDPQGVRAAQETSVLLEYQPARVDNPLKGLVPYEGNYGDRFPHSMEFNYLPLNALVMGPGEYDWEPLERLLNRVASRGHQAIFRIYLEYPGKRSGIPDYLIDAGLTIHTYLNTNTQPFPPKQVLTPDYEDPRLRAMLQAFIRELGDRYDGDPRIGYITAGLLGTWGEWHTYPREELFASKTVQREVMNAYEEAFTTTPVLLRYPAGEEHWMYAPNHRRSFGYHDDSFAWATLQTGKPEDSWFYMAILQDAGVEATSKWKTEPIGGEIRPELWGRIFDEDPGILEAQDFLQCVETTHATWLMDTGMFREDPTPERYQRAVTMVRRMGYEYHVPAVVTSLEERQQLLEVEIDVTNCGVAPFYQEWPLEVALLSGDNRMIQGFESTGNVSGILPGVTTTWSASRQISDVPRGRYWILVQIPSPLPGGQPLRFANRTQDQDREGWLTISGVRIPDGTVSPPRSD